MRQAVYSFMLKYQERNGRPPLMREIAEHFGHLSWRSSVLYEILCLEAEGLAEAAGKPGTQRRWRAIDNGRSSNTEPVTDSVVDRSGDHK